MPRVARIIKDEGVFHVMSRGNNKQWIFHDDEDFKKFLNLLALHKESKPFYLYHYALLNNHFNHFHLLLEPHPGQTISKIMQGVKLSYFYYYRKKYNYFGHLFQDRFKSILIEKDRHLLSCGAYIELNPVRAGITKRAEDYPYSSCLYYTQGKGLSLIEPDPLYLELSNKKEVRIKMYKDFIENESMRDSSYSKGNYIGSDAFEKKIKEDYGIEKVARKQGRPRKEK